MKRRVLLRSIADASRAGGLSWELVRQGSEHEVWMLDGEDVIVPRHREINELTARGILKRLESKLGKDWWRQ